MDQYWDWVTNAFLPRLRAGDWYNGAKPSNLAGMHSACCCYSHPFSLARFHRGQIEPHTRLCHHASATYQARYDALFFPSVSSRTSTASFLDSCKVLSSFKNIVTSCEAGYSIFGEDKRSFYPGWTTLYNATVGDSPDFKSSINQAFVYNNSDNLDTYTYIGEHATYGAGGYVYNFRGKMNEIIANISMLRELSWIDMQTRAVMIQLNLYNPNINLFTLVTILAEFLPTGGIYPSARFEPVQLLNDFQGKNGSTIAGEVTLARLCHVQASHCSN